MVLFQSSRGHRALVSVILSLFLRHIERTSAQGLSALPVPLPLSLPGFRNRPTRLPPSHQPDPVTSLW